MSENHSERDFEARRQGAQKAIEDLRLTDDAEFFADKENRLEFLRSLDGVEFLDLTRHINSRVRGLDPREHKAIREQGAALPLMPTPQGDEKKSSFVAGYDEIRKYLEASDDTPGEKILSVGMAAEALIIWVHPFNDGNGRTSRFVGEFIDSGTTDVDGLIAASSKSANRPRAYGTQYRVDQGNMVKGMDLILDDDEIEELKQTEMPMSEGIVLSLRRLLEDKNVQARILAKEKGYRDSFNSQRDRAA